MNPRIGKRSKYNETAKQPESNAVVFIERNTKKSITLKQEYLYVEDVRTALNIHHLEVHIRLKRWLIGQLSTGKSQESLLKVIEESMEHDRHRLQKHFKIKM